MIDDTIIMLYQNKGKEAVEKVVSILELFQEMLRKYKGQNYIEIQKEGVELQQSLLMAYKIQDILAMADCLEVKGKRFLCKYYKEGVSV